MNIPIFMICDDNYSPYMAVMIASICQNASCCVSFYVVGKGISDENKKLIEKMKKRFPNFEIEYRNVDITNEYDIPYLTLSRMTSSTFIRMLLPDLYPELNKALIMDVDMISMKDIKELWEKDLGDYIFAAALDEPLDAYYMFKKNLEVNTDCKYANCGLMLINCKKWRENNITQRCIAIEKRYRNKLICADQDVINKVFLGNFMELDNKYNSLFGNETEIVNRHFCFLRKPWISRYNIEGLLIKNFNDWWYYAKMTPFYEQLMKQYNEINNDGEANLCQKAKDNYKRMEMIAYIRNKIKNKL